MDTSYSQTEIAALLERKFDAIAAIKKTDKEDLSNLGLKGFTLVDVGKFPREEYKGKYPEDWVSKKAIVVKDAQGNLYVHFNGTGDGNWSYNAVAYGPQNGNITSPIQDWALEYFDKTVSKYYEGQANGKLYVSGHSQGGNNAQFVTIRSQYGDYIERCTSLDGPGFSTASVEEAKVLYGEAFYERQRNKIYAYNGTYDYVSCLGQEQIVPDGHIQYIAYDYENNGFNVELFHHSKGLFFVDKDGNIRDKDGNIRLGDIQDNYSDFRELVLALNQQVLKLPADQQQDAASLVMKLCENMLGGGEVVTVEFSDEDKELLKILLAQVLAEGIEENPVLIKRVLLEMGIDPAAVDLIGVMIDEFNELPEGLRKEALESLIDFAFEYGSDIIENGFSADMLITLLPALAAAVPVIIETALHHPEDLMTVLYEFGVDKIIVNFIKGHPGATIAIAIGIAVFLPVIIDIAKAIIIIDVAIHFVEGLIDIANHVKDFILKVFNAAKEAYEKTKEWFKKTFFPGSDYAQSNPYINVDTQSLRSYAQRLFSVNSRLSTLDGDLRSLYWQVGFLDLWDILVANLLTSPSYAIAKVREYLNSTATDFDNAEAKVKSYLGG